ncbi:MAG: hypothetical protein ABI690_14125 [Chloroflexota bacterium]
MDFITTLHSWQNFYFMVGGASAGLIGLMFVALSLGIHLVNEQTLSQMEAFATPSVIYFASTLLIACTMLVPDYLPLFLGVILFLGGIAGLLRSRSHIRQLVKVALQYRDFTLWDWLSQIIFPALSYVLLLVGGMSFVVEQWSLAFAGVWAASILLLVCGIANTWSLVIWIVQHSQPS